MPTTVLSVGLHPSAIDYGRHPDEAEAVVRDCAGSRSFGVVMIGAGVRTTPEHTELFERLVNVINQVAPGISFCFNTSPESTIEALRRWVIPTDVRRLNH
jgi:hypothetical protein